MPSLRWDSASPSSREERHGSRCGGGGSGTARRARMWRRRRAWWGAWSSLVPLCELGERFVNPPLPQFDPFVPSRCVSIAVARQARDVEVGTSIGSALRLRNQMLERRILELERSLAPAATRLLAPYRGTLVREPCAAIPLLFALSPSIAGADLAFRGDELARLLPAQIPSSFCHVRGVLSRGSPQ